MDANNRTVLHLMAHLAGSHGLQIGGLAKGSSPAARARRVLERGRTRPLPVGCGCSTAAARFLGQVASYGRTAPPLPSRPRFRSTKGRADGFVSETLL